MEFDPEEMAEVIAGCEALTFASPSAVESLVQGLGERAGTILSTPICLAIGETTASALRRQGLSADVIAKAPDAEGMIEALAAHFGSSSSAPED